MFFSLVLGIIALLATRGVAQEFLEYDCNGSGMCAGFACGGSSGCIQQLHDMINGVNTSRLFMVEEQIACVKPRPGPGICAFYQPYVLSNPMD
ncbi:MAG: hypothetical protein M1838_003071 [Thelocarpon superellum]|nr:MAG: hypothetical protein M1838_003071 [Thelocarpon superellum]